MKITRDSSNRVRMNFRRRRKDGTYLNVESFGIYSEGFLFFQEYARKDTGSAPADVYQDVENNMKNVAMLAQNLFVNASPITSQQLQDLKWLHDDARGVEPAKEEVRFLDCMHEVVTYGTMLRDNINNNAKSSSRTVRFRASLGVSPEEGKDIILTTNSKRFVRSLTSLLDAAFAVTTNHEILFEAKVIRLSTRSFVFAVHAAGFQQDDFALEAAKSFATLSHDGSFHSKTVGDITQLMLFFEFKSELQSSDTCLLVDDDDTVLTIMKKRITSTWKDLYHEDISVITAKTGQDAIRFAKRHLPKRFVFACIDLNLSDSSHYTGEETMQAIKQLKCADRVVLLTATAPSTKMFETIYMKGSPDLYKDLCRGKC
jgi:CheY-like chemotaxis protein